MGRRHATWQRGQCTICLLHERYLIWPMPRMLVWHQHGWTPIVLDEVAEGDYKDRWHDVYGWDDWYDLEPVDMPHYNRQHRKRRKP